VPDNTAVGGAKRGQHAVDWQTLRAGSNRVASGDNSVLAGGADNISAANWGTVSGGNANTVFTGAENAVISGGASNEVRSGAINSGIGSGNANIVESTYSYVAAGFQNQIINVGNVFSVIGGGTTNTITDSSHAFIGGGLANVLGGNGDPADYSSIVGGDTNGVYGNYNFLGGGTGNNIGTPGNLVNYSSIVGGTTNSIGANSDYSTINGGFGNIVSPDLTHASIYGGKSNVVTADGNYGTALGGYYGVSSHYAEAAHSSGVTTSGATVSFVAGGAQHSWVVWRNIVPNTATATQLYLDGDDGVTAGSPFVFTLQQNDDTYLFELQFVAKDTVNAGQAAFWKVIGGVTRNGAGTTALIGSPTVTTQNTGGLSAGWTITITADAASDTLRIYATVPAAVGSAPVAVVASGHMSRCCPA